MNGQRLERLRLTLILGVRNLRLHKLRSLLTVLGLVFGVASVIAMLAIGEGASLEAQRQIQELGATNVIVRSVKPLEEKKENEDNYVLIYGLTYDDFDRIVETIPTVVRATPMREFRQEIRFQDRYLEGEVAGVTPDYARMNGLQLTQGRFISELDLSQFQNVVVIGSEVAEKLFPYENPLNKSIRVGSNHYYRVVGVSAYKAPTGGAGGSLAGEEFNKDVYIPITTNRARFGDVINFQTEGSSTWEQIELSQITVAVRDMPSVKKTAEVIEGLLDQFHPRKDFSITVPLELLEKAEATKRIFNVVLGSIASISLLVGGIGIMNIMLATVTERTREIGIHRALGARRRDILLQFLVETGILSITGGILGVGLGLIVPSLVGRLSHMPVVLSLWAPVLAFAIAIAVGISFGVYPARRAAMMDPIEALREE